MAHKAWIQIVQAAQSLMDRVVETGGTAGQPFLQNEEFVSQICLEEASPALFFIETASCFRAVAMGVGVAIAYDVFFHKNPLKAWKSSKPTQRRQGLPG